MHMQVYSIHVEKVRDQNRQRPMSHLQRVPCETKQVTVQDKPR